MVARELPIKIIENGINFCKPTAGTISSLRVAPEQRREDIERHRAKVLKEPKGPLGRVTAAKMVGCRWLMAQPRLVFGD
jgi:hypothetical protein